MKANTTMTLAAIAAGLHLQAAPPAAPGYVAHEWGTFTSVQGADGVETPWQPFTTSELPQFVHDLNWPAGRENAQPTFIGGKATQSMLQRMETPVIYFHSERPLRVGVTVDFPLGVVTEWYPRDAAMSSIGDNSANRRTALNRLHWPDVEILDRSAAAPNFPMDASGSHYFAARATAANPVRVTTPGGGAQMEKFLFYRGVGNFKAPLRVGVTGDTSDTLELVNEGMEPLPHVFVYQVIGDRTKFQSLAGVDVGSEARTLVPLAGKESMVQELPLAEARPRIAREIQKALVAEGLYEDEAAAMVKTWDDSWFSEPGTRVLYTLPRAWTDRILPLALTPAPRELVRVMVGRAEVLMPEVEFAVLRELVRHADGNAAERKLAAENLRRLDLGRFAEPALRRAAKASPPTPAVRQAIAALIQSAAQSPAPKQSAQTARASGAPLARR